MYNSKFTYRELSKKSLGVNIITQHDVKRLLSDSNRRFIEYFKKYFGLDLTKYVLGSDKLWK